MSNDGYKSNLSSEWSDGQSHGDQIMHYHPIYSLFIYYPYCLLDLGITNNIPVIFQFHSSWFHSRTQVSSKYIRKNTKFLYAKNQKKKENVGNTKACYGFRVWVILCRFLMMQHYYVFVCVCMFVWEKTEDSYIYMYIYIYIYLYIYLYLYLYIIYIHIYIYIYIDI